MFEKPEINQNFNFQDRKTKYSNEELLKFAKEFYHMRNSNDFTSREWNSWKNRPMNAESIGKRFKGFTRFKVEACIPTHSRFTNVSPIEATNHLLSCINKLQDLPSYRTYNKYCKDVGVMVGRWHFDKYWYKFERQVKRCEQHYKGDITYDELVKPLRKYTKSEPSRKKSSEDEACDMTKISIEKNGFSIENPLYISSGNTYRFGAYGNADFVKYLKGKIPDFIIDIYIDNKELLPIECKNSKSKLHEAVVEVEEYARLLNNSKKYHCTYAIAVAGNDFEGYKIETRKLLDKGKYKLYKVQEIDRKSFFSLPSYEVN